MTEEEFGVLSLPNGVFVLVPGTRTEIMQKTGIDVVATYSYNDLGKMNLVMDASFPYETLPEDVDTYLYVRNIPSEETAAEVTLSVLRDWQDLFLLEFLLVCLLYILALLGVIGYVLLLVPVAVTFATTLVLLVQAHWKHHKSKKISPFDR